MPNLSIKPAFADVQPTGDTAPEPAYVVAIGRGEVAPVGSPARALHDRLVATFIEAPNAAEPTLSLRAKLAILVVASIGLWLAIALLAMAIL